MAESILQDLEELLECSLCMEICDNPKTLPCHHWYCKPCIVKLIEKSKQPNSFVCPTCRVEVPTPPEGAAGFPAAFFVNRFVEAVKVQRGLIGSPRVRHMATFCSNFTSQ